MTRVISSERHPIKLWLDNLDDNAEQQAKNLANLPFVFRHVAIMPDAHQGIGMPIGGVLATNDAVIPAAVGVDIGCGMIACNTGIPAEMVEKPALKQIMSEIRRTIPVGFDKNKEKCHVDFMPLPVYILPGGVVDGEFEKARYSLGTLGGGNHFIEIQKDQAGDLWIMIHSGSRNLGKMVADHYDKVAINLNARWHSAVPAEWKLAFLPLSTDVADRYFTEMEYCVEYALANRKEMMRRVCAAFQEVLQCLNIGEIDHQDSINIAHNYAAMEHHFGTDVLVHRKGATRARKDELGIIPGSQGSKSYIVRGKGNPDSFQSCSHGAGRKLGRKAAERELDLEAEVAALEAQGIIHSVRNKAGLDEAPGAYKSIQEVMANQTDLVDIVVELTPLAVVKG